MVAHPVVLVGLGALFMYLIYLGYIYNGRRRYKAKFKPIRWEIVDLIDVLNAAKDSSAADSKIKIDYAIKELWRLV